MILYNVTLSIDRDVHIDWARWMREQHIPDVMSTGMFISYRFSRLISDDQEDAETYTVQYLLKDMAHLHRYQAEFAPDLQRDHRERYEGKFVAFRTIMEVVDHNEKI
jgi:Domain of unknown function (DUF4286)